MLETHHWHPGSWRGLPIQQQPQYEDTAALDSVLQQIRQAPPLVFSGEVLRLKQLLAEAGEGKRFILQGGDCAERFIDCQPDPISRKLKILLKMSLILSYGARKPIVRIGRIAGQYAKPRSDNTEMINGMQIPVYRGDCVNRIEATVEARQADPGRLLDAYRYAAITLNYIRSLVSGGFADLHDPHKWDLGFFANSPHQERFANIVDSIRDAVDFLGAIGVTSADVMNRVEFFTSHEGLLLPFEEALTHYDETQASFYDLSAHMLWIGDRTRQLQGAHIEFFRGVANPVGLKVGPGAKPKDIVELAKKLNPGQEPGKLMLITRYGVDRVRAFLPDQIKAVQDAGLKVVWSCDPMHGNITKTEARIKTRDFAAIIGELEQCFGVHDQLQSNLAGVHFELTGDNVTECIGGASGVSEADLHKNYESYCDPRLNYNQSLEMAFRIADMLKSKSK